MKLITELIEYVLQHNMLTEENKRKLQEDGFYTFYNEDVDDEYEYGYWESSKDDYENELDRTFYGDFYRPGKRYGRRHHGDAAKSHKDNNTNTGLEHLELSDLEERLTAAFKRWDKSLEPLVLTVSFLTNHGMNAQGRDLSTWQNASNWLFEVKEQKLFDAVSKLDITQILKFTELCSCLTWHKLQELLVEPIFQCEGLSVTTYKELIQVTNESVSESAQDMLQNELFAQVYRLAAGWSKIC